MVADDNYCKVTVHRASPPFKAQNAMDSPPLPPPRGRRQTIATEAAMAPFFFPRQRAALHPERATERHARGLSEVIPDEEFDAMLQSADQTRRRARTDAVAAHSDKGRRRNPLSRLTLRWTEQRESAKLAAGASYDNDYDDGRSNDTLDVLDDPLSQFDDDDDDDEAPLLGMSADDEFNNNSFLDCDTNECDPQVRQTMEDVFAAGTPPIPAGLTLDMLPTAFTDPSLPRSFARGHFSSSVGPDSFQLPPHAPSDTDDDDDDDDTSSVATSSQFGDESDEEVNIDEIRGKAEAIARFEASFHDRATPLLRSTELPKVRAVRGMSSPVRKLSQVVRARKQSNPVNPRRTPGSSSSDDLQIARTALYSGQTLHLNFKNSRGQIVQVSGQPKKSASKNIFSKRIRCQTVDEALPIDIRDALRIIGHTTDGIIHGGDCISIARNDGHVLRLQKLSRKLCFSAKIDLRAKFIVAGVPEGTVVTAKTKFYLQSVYDRSKTVGFLNSRRSSSPGCLVMYVYRSKEDKSEPIQFYQRAEPAFADLVPTRHHRVVQQQQQLATEILTPITLVVD
ncbi:hypothetical protein PybrP1_001833 [[Pythium] brassicae (nom. inval.)]|nr:hypothetical protein PybrP1_001833 [[Pythium] brassicae (nom. inval.)]